MAIPLGEPARQGHLRVGGNLALYIDKVNGQVVTRHTPPTEFRHWPHAAGAKVNVSYTRERPLDRQTEEISLTCESGPLESVTVSAGTFDAVRVTCRNRLTNAMSFEAPLRGRGRRDQGP
jgi:hypothetical protein